jgi:hypothetical protein
VITRILAQESPNSELQLKRYGQKNFGGQNWKSGNIQGYIWKYKMLEGLLYKKIGAKM